MILNVAEASQGFGVSPMFAPLALAFLIAGIALFVQSLTRCLEKHKP